MKQINERKRARLTGRGKKIPFLMINHDVIASDEFALLDGSGLKLLIDLASQFRGSNNGDLSPALLRSRWRSEQKLTRAIKVLVKGGWIVKTKQGGLHMGPDLYAITWWPIDAMKNHDHPGERMPSNAWKNKSPHPNRVLRTPDPGATSTAESAPKHPNRVR